MQDQAKAKAIKLYEVGLILRIIAILLAMALPMVLKGIDAIVTILKIGLIGEGVATLVMTAALAALLRTPGPERGRVALAFALHLTALVVITIDTLWVMGAIWQELSDRGAWQAVHDRRQLLNLLQYGAAVLGIIAMLLATSTMARRLGHDMFGDRALGFIKLAVGFGVILFGFWWWTKGRVQVGALYAATVGVRMAATVVIALYLGTLRQLRRLLVDPEQRAGAAPELP